MSPDKLSKSLNGHRAWSALELALIADAASTTVDWLLTGAEVEAPSLAARTTMARAVDHRASIEMMERFADADSQLQRLNGRRELKPLTGAKSVAARVAWAQSMLARGGKNVQTLDNAALADAVEEVFDIDVAIDVLPDGVDGCAWQTSSARIVTLRSTPYWARQRYTLAHELGHILACDAQDLITESVDHRDKSPQEKAADRFAAYFLMPEAVLRGASPSGRLDRDTFLRLVNTLHVSPAALGWRAFNLGLIDDVQRPRWGALTAEQCALEAGEAELISQSRAGSENRRLPRRIVNGHLRAYWAGQTSARPLARLLGTKPEEVIRLIPARMSTS
ncbi:ImmA/IrrE family metallo-endopeptidase [Oerskovia jenensis]|uniref:ImmA/IrrE family metallo-endopeptidase n=1 Tax=Oerskovia jenensis TaxID=162169 RepID=UPI0036DC8A86